MHQGFLPRLSVTSPTWCVTPPRKISGKSGKGAGGNLSVWAAAVQRTQPGSVSLKPNPILRWRIDCLGSQLRYDIQKDNDNLQCSENHVRTGPGHDLTTLL